MPRLGPHKIVTAKGDIIYAIHNEIHRADGPAMIMANGLKRWFWHNKSYSFEEYLVVAGWSEDQIVEYKLKNS